ncbi:cytochrome P450 2J2-like [Oppia nitens]|uniref:cytochrome P450 2J2-like n=1 Tax=Oppia nitens TaxID=1686743 RepID=UPI0023D9F9AD|nr:cytochrome P450 2J2-like [Oppia nitens]
MDAIVLNDFDSISEAFKKDEFLGRPKSVAFNVLMELKGFGTLSGNEWKEQKRFTLYQLRNLGFGKISMEKHINDEMIDLCQRIYQLNGKPVKIRTLLASSTSSNISALVFGKRFAYTDPNRAILDECIERAIRKLGQTGFITFFPSFAKFCANLGLFGLNEVKKDFMIVNNYIRKQINEHKQTLDDNYIRDYIDAFLVKMKNENMTKTSFTLDMLAGNVQGFFAAGTETVKTSIEWALLIIADHQHIQREVQTEIDNICGRQVFPSWSQRNAMPLTQAVINEIFRWKTISPLNLLRITTNDTSVDNYTIKKDTVVIANLWAVHNDPLYWVSPHQFNPYRFLSDDRKQMLKYDNLIPFSIGKRSCPGESLAQTEIFVCFTALLQKFNISPINEVSYEEDMGLILRPKHAVTLRFEPRL